MTNPIARLQRIIDTEVKGKWMPRHNQFGHFYQEISSGKVVPSVTTQNVVSKPHLIHWAARKTAEAFKNDPILFQRYVEKEKEIEKMPTGRKEPNPYLLAAQQSYQDFTEDAGNVGTLAHNLIEKYVNMWINTGVRPRDIKELADESENKEYRAIAVARSAEEVFKKYPVVPIAAELIVGHTLWNMAGTLDLLVYNTETKEVELWDHKSSNSIDDDYARQTAAYKYMIEKMTKGKIKIKKIRVNKLDKWTNKFTSYLVTDPKSALKAQLANNEIYKWKESPMPKLIIDKNKLII
jgi:hypothetical protein